MPAWMCMQNIIPIILSYTVLITRRDFSNLWNTNIQIFLPISLTFFQLYNRLIFSNNIKKKTENVDDFSYLRYNR